MSRWRQEHPQPHPNPISIDDLMITKKTICTPTLRPSETSPSSLYTNKWMYTTIDLVLLNALIWSGAVRDQWSRWNTHPDHLLISSVWQLAEMSLCSHSSGLRVTETSAKAPQYQNFHPPSSSISPGHGSRFVHLSLGRMLSEGT